jgi:hypothetical protein
VRFALAVVGAGIVQIIPYLIPTFTTIGAIAFVLFAAFGAGFFAGRRGWLAGALSVLLGGALFGAVSLVGPNAAGETLLDMLQSETALVLAMLPYALGGALAGAGGSWLRSRSLARA